jgi:hypothetical protein
LTVLKTEFSPTLLALALYSGLSGESMSEVHNADWLARQHDKKSDHIKGDRVTLYKGRIQGRSATRRND